MNQAEKAELLEQIEKWNDADEFARCIEAIEAIPEQERDYLLTLKLSRAYSNLAVLGDHGALGENAEVDGDFLRLCAKLVDEGYVSLETLTEVSGIVAAMRDVLPKPEQPTTTSVEAPLTPAPSVAMGSENSKPMSKDPVDSMKGWPTQEKRENRKSFSVQTEI